MKRKILFYLGILMITIPLGFFSYSFIDSKLRQKEHNEQVEEIDKIEEKLKDDLGDSDNKDDKKDNEKAKQGEINRITPEERERAFREYVNNLRNEFGNQDVIGRIRLPKLNIDYTLMHSHDNYEYLYLNPYGVNAVGGSIFLDKDNNEDLSDFNSRVFGHRMIYEKTMFTTLEYFLDQSFVDKKNNYFTITGFGGEHVYDIVSAFVIPSDKSYVPLNYSTDFTKLIKESSYCDFGHNLDDVDENDKFVTLIACTLRGDNRTVVIGRQRSY